MKLNRKSVVAPAVAACSVLFTLTASLSAADWKSYRGPNHDGSSPEKIVHTWPAQGPKVVWKAPLTDGFSSFAVSKGRAISLVERNIDGANQEVCVALDADNGKELWATPLGIAKYDGGGDAGTSDNKGGDGPRSTPTLDGDRVYVMSAQLKLLCLDAATGKVVWSKELLKEHDGKLITWQNAASVLVDGDMVFVAGGGPGQALLGIRKTDGTVVWKGQDDRMTHSTPVAATIHGVRQVIFLTQSGLVSVAPKNGQVLWRHPFPFKTSTAISPVVAGDIVYCSAGYGVGSGAAKISKQGNQFTATELWRLPGNKLCNHWSTPVQKDGYLYGLFSFKEYGDGPLRCVELATGKEVWAQEGFGPGGVVLVDGKLLVLGDRGQLVMAEASPKGYKELSRAQVVEGKCWNHPVVANGRIYARSTKQGVCLDVSPKTAQK